MDKRIKKKKKEKPSWCTRFHARRKNYFFASKRRLASSFLDVYIFILHQQCVSTAMKNRMYCWSLVLRYCLHLPLPSPPPKKRKKIRKKRTDFFEEEHPSTFFYNVDRRNSRKIYKLCTCTRSASSVFGVMLVRIFLP